MQVPRRCLLMARALRLQFPRKRHLTYERPRACNPNEQLNRGIENAMTKRPHDSISASPYAPRPGRQSSHDADGNGSHEDGEGSSLKKPRSFMATLVCRTPPESTTSPLIPCRLAISVAPGKHDVTRTGQNVVIAGP